MHFDMVCATWIKPEDEKVLDVLAKSDRWLTAKELATITGLSQTRVECTLTLLAQQMRLARGRKKFSELFESSE